MSVLRLSNSYTSHEYEGLPGRQCNKPYVYVDLEHALLLQVLRVLLRLLHTDILHLAPCPLKLLVPQLLRSLPRLLLLLLAQELCTARLLLLLPHR